jgi:hypothetical protein
MSKPRIRFTLTGWMLTVAVASVVLMILGVVAIVVYLMCSGVCQSWDRMSAGVARSETIAIEAAWLAYTNDYGRWPTLGGIPPSTMEGTPVRLSGDALAILMGNNVSANNPNEVKYLSSFDSVNADGTAINPWGDKSLRDAATPPESFYYMKFDMNADSTIRVARASDEPPTNNIPKSVIVWTINPNVPTGRPGRVVGGF